MVPLECQQEAAQCVRFRLVGWEVHGSTTSQHHVAAVMRIRKCCGLWRLQAQLAHCFGAAECEFTDDRTMVSWRLLLFTHAASADTNGSQVRPTCHVAPRACTLHKSHPRPSQLCFPKLKSEKLLPRDFCTLCLFLKKRDMCPHMQVEFNSRSIQSF